ncbi:MAG TPA: TetR/AcrR family transcriptional regulator [Candidatus Brocadiia bacterium]|nr:TetR/AcrR family transcriptional regulator [Candidatus Brocadiia bacterium]
MAGKKGTDTRQRILQAASALFAERGFDATSVREIVEAAGVAKPALYYYFKNKVELGRSLLAENFEEFIDELQAAIAQTGEATDRIEAIVWAHFSACNENLDLTRFIYATSFGPGASPFSRDGVDFNDRLRRMISAAMKELQRDGSIRKDMDADYLATSLQGSAQIWMMLEIKRKQSLLTRKLSRKIARTFLEGAGTTDGREA